MLNVFWDLQQDHQIRQAAISAEQSSAASRSTRAAVDDVDERFDRLLLVCEAMWSLLRERAGLSEEDLLRRVTELDLSDGQLDGRMTREIARCAKCDSAVCQKFNRCLFCGEEYSGGTAFSSV